MQPLHREARALAWPWHCPEALAASDLRAPDHAASAADPQVCDVMRRIWPDGRPLIPGFLAFAQTLHRPNGDHRVLVGDHDQPGREILRWRALTMRLPPGMLIAAGCPIERGPAPLRLQLLDRLVAPTNPVAHLHLHVNAALSFELVWAHLCARAPKTIKAAPEGLTPATWLGWIARARVARMLLDARLTWPDCAWPILAGRVGRRAAVLRAVSELRGGRVGSGSASAVNSLADRRRSKRLRTVDDVWRNDPLSDAAPWPEGRFLQRAFRAASAEPTGDFSRIFAQYLRVRCLLYRHLLDDPDAQGLGLFTTIYDHLKPYREGLDHVLPQVAAVEPPLRLGALEVRTGPPDGPAELRAMADQLRRAAQVHPGLEVGWVFHVIRHLKADKPMVRLVRATRKAIAPLMTALRAEPRLLRLIRGLDIAGDEMAGPLWLALPSLERARRLSVRLAARHLVPPLQVSVHVGEDFRHLASGLRSIDEPLEWSALVRGDRLGHALALGLDAAAWVDANPEVEVSAWSRLLDLEWMIHRVERATDPQLRARVVDLPYLHAQLKQLRAGFGIPADANAWSVLGRPAHVVRLARHEPPRNSAERLVVRRLFDPRGGILDRSVPVNPAPERAVLVALRAALARRVRARQIVVELNPSSNLSVAGFEHPLAQRHYHLLPWNESDAPVPHLTLSADDPLQFATNLSDEYAYAWAGLVTGARRPHGEVQVWLEQAAASSWRARFTGP